MGFIKVMASEQGMVLACTHLNSDFTINSATVAFVTSDLDIIEDITQNHVTLADTIAPIWVIHISISEAENLT